MYVTAGIITVAALAAGVVAAQAKTRAVAQSAAVNSPADAGRAPAGQSGLPTGAGPQVEAHGHDDHEIGSRDYTPGAPAPAATQALDVVRAFAHAWARPDLDSSKWWDGIAPLCEPGFATRLKTTDPATIPANDIAGGPEIAESRTDLLTARVPTAGGTLTVTAALLGGQWLVTGNDYTRNAS